MSWTLAPHYSVNNAHFNYAAYRASKRKVGRPALVFRCMLENEGVTCQYICRRVKRIESHQNCAKHTQKKTNKPKDMDILRQLNAILPKTKKRLGITLSHSSTAKMPDPATFTQKASSRDKSICQKPARRKSRVCLPPIKALPLDATLLFEEIVLVVKKNSTGGLTDYVPTECTHKSDHCNIWSKGMASARACFDHPLPTLLKIPLYYCSTHRCSFSLLMKLTGEQKEEQLVSNLLLHDFSHILATHKFVKYVYEQLPEHGYNFAALQRSITKLWISSIEEKVLMMRAHGQFADTDIPQAVQKVSKLMNLCTKSLKKIYMHYWFTSGVHEYSSYMSALHQRTGETLRADHTYKIARSVTAYSKVWKKRVCLKASLFSILNEHGHVMATSLVPNDCRKYFYKAFSQIWLAEGRDESEQGVKTKFVYTDDVRKDSATILLIYTILNHGMEEPLVLQDVWHAIQRVDRLLDKNHPDYKAAKASFSSIFALLQTSEIYTKDKLKSEIDSWRVKYKTLSSRSCMPLNDIITCLASAVHSNRKHDFTQGQAFNPLVSDKVNLAVDNLIEEPVLSSLFNITKHKNAKQGTSMNEIWHKNIGKKCSQLSNSMSIELLTMFLCQMALAYNRSKDTAHLSYKQHLAMRISNVLCLQHIPFIVTFSEIASNATFEQLQTKEFKHKKFCPSKVAAEDIQICKEALQEIATKGKSIPQRDLLYYIQHYHFTDLYNKKYIKQVVFTVLKLYNTNQR